MNMNAAFSFNNALWRKSSRSTASTNCVEVATVNGLIGVRDSKNPHRAILVSSHQWENLIQDTKHGNLDL